MSKHKFEQINKWKILSAEMVLDNRFYKVQKERVETKPGHEIDYFVSLWEDVAVIVALTARKEVILVSEYKHGVQEVLCQLPAGYTDKNEEPLIAAKRELAEETGFTSQQWKKIGFFHQNSSKERGNNLHIFLAQGAQKTSEQHFDENENIEVVNVPFQKALDMIKAGTINTASSALALLLVEEYLKKL